jgi:uncharacterized damage-inducible protein DinB
MGIVDDLGQAQADVLEAIDGLTAEELTRENAIGKWSVRDTLLHMAMWDGEALKALAIWRTGHDADMSYTKNYGKFNDFWYENMKELSATQVIQMFNLTCHALTCDVSAVGDDIWQKRGGIPKWLNFIVITHGNHHLAKIQEYRKSLGK